MPQQIRSVNFLTNPTKLSYILMYGWNDGVKPDKVILGHWANMADTRYGYTADEYCDFSNYSNDYRVPDSAATEAKKQALSSAIASAESAAENSAATEADYTEAYTKLSNAMTAFTSAESTGYISSGGSRVQAIPLYSG